jgi:hypothetical protein
MNCLSRRAENDVPGTPAFPAPMAPALPTPALPTPAVVLHVAVLVVVGETVGIVGTDELAPTLPTIGNTFGTGTAGVELTPRLPISKDPIGSPVRAAPPGVVGDVNVGLDDAAILLEPEPHIPDIPEVSIPDVPIGTDICDDVDVPGVVVGSVVAAVAGAAVPADVPPPSKLAVDPNISEGEVATVGHAVLLLVVGMVIVPVTPVGSGLTPGEVISVEPSGIPVGEPAAMPSGEVAPMVGVGATVPSNCPSTCAMATLQTKSAGRTAATNESLIGILHSRRTPATGSPGVRLSDIGQSLRGAASSFGK